MSEVPVVDISKPTETSMSALDSACRDHGFFLLTGHGLDNLIQAMWNETERFFDAKQQVRESVRRQGDSPFGYNDRELTKRKRDHKQVFDYGCPTNAAARELNRWPKRLDGFREVMVDFHEAFGELAVQTTSLVHDTLQLSAAGRNVLVGDPGRSSVRLNHYPVGDPVPERDRDDLADLGPTALGYHTDPGVLTLLLQDNTGGLQTQALNGEWLDVAPLPGTVVVNLADAVQVWTNDQYRAAIHRVEEMTSHRRFSIPFFLNPARGARIEPLEELCTEPAKYRPFSWRQFIQARNDDNFADAGAADAQISDYRISVNS